MFIRVSCVICVTIVIMFVENLIVKLKYNKMKTKIEIKCVFGKLLFEYETENNTIRKTLEKAIESSADLSSADLSYANLSYANLSSANLRSADLDKKDIKAIKHLYQIIPEVGSFIAYKKASNNCVVKLEIPARAKRTCNFKNRKCRASYVRVLEITNRDGTKIKEVTGERNSNTIYKVNKITRADSFNDDMREDCSHGIHFFVTKQEAINW